MGHRILKDPETNKKAGLSRSTKYELIRQGKFPPPIKLSDRSVGWVESEIDAWIDERIRASRGKAA